MPMYSYRCRECRTHTDKFQRMSEPMPTKCPSCDKDGLEKQLTAPGFAISGAGVYSPGLKVSRVLPPTLEEAGAKDPVFR